MGTAAPSTTSSSAVTTFFLGAGAKSAEVATHRPSLPSSQQPSGEQAVHGVIHQIELSSSLQWQLHRRRAGGAAGGDGSSCHAMWPPQVMCCNWKLTENGLKPAKPGNQLNPARTVNLSPYGLDRSKPASPAVCGLGCKTSSNL
ncbi:unnamed protein product [Urochloa humidicola]